MPRTLVGKGRIAAQDRGAAKRSEIVPDAREVLPQPVRANGARRGSPVGAPGASAAPDARWHLAASAAEVAATELEFSLFRVYASFERWQVECLATVANERLTCTENAVLHVIRLKDRPKSAADTARLLNRDDISNINYAIRKLLSLKLVERCPTEGGKGAAYRVTQRGAEVTEKYAALRREVLFRMIPSVDHWDEQNATARQVLDLMRGIYEQAALFLATHRERLGSS